MSRVRLMCGHQPVTCAQVCAGGGNIARAHAATKVGCVGKGGNVYALRTASVRVVPRRRGAYSTHVERPAPGAWSPRRMRGVCEAVPLYARRRGATICEKRGSTEQARIAPAAWSPRRMRGICEVVREAARGDYLRKEGGARWTRGKQHTRAGSTTRRGRRGERRMYTAR